MMMVMMMMVMWHMASTILTRVRRVCHGRSGAIVRAMVHIRILVTCINLS